MSRAAVAPITKAEFSRETGRSKSAIGQAAKPGGVLFSALLPGGKLDRSHHACTDYAAAAKGSRKPKGRGRTTAKKPPKASRSTEPTADRDDAAPLDPAQFQEPADISELLKLTLGELTERWGSVEGAQGWLNCRKVVADIARLEAKNARDAGRIISRQLVKTHVLGQFQRLHQRLLETYPTTLTTRLGAAIRAGESREACAEIVRSLLGKELEVAKNKSIRAIRRCETSDNPPEVEPPTPAADPAIAARRELSDVVRKRMEEVAPSLAKTDSQEAITSILHTLVDDALRRSAAP